MLTVSMPYYRTGETVARAVESILGQTGVDLRLVVVNDGATDPWEPLAHIQDPRLVRFDLDRNRGRYYCDAVVLAACQTEWFAPHDSDDWSDKTRYRRLLAKGKDHDVVFGAYTRHYPDGRTVVKVPKPQGKGLNHIATHIGLYRTDVLRSIGVPHPGYRIAFDTLMVNMLMARFDCNVELRSSYHHVLRPGSASRNPATGIGSGNRQSVHHKLKRIWRQLQAADTDQWAAILAPPKALSRSVHRDARRLRGLL